MGSGETGTTASEETRTSGSAICANCKASELVMSVFDAVTARMMALGAVMYSRHMERSCCSMSAGWSPVGTCRQHKVYQGTFARRQSTWQLVFGTAYLCQPREIDNSKIEHP